MNLAFHLGSLVVFVVMLMRLVAARRQRRTVRLALESVLDATPGTAEVMRPSPVILSLGLAPLRDLGGMLGMSVDLPRVAAWLGRAASPTRMNLGLVLRGLIAARPEGIRGRRKSVPDGGEWVVVLEGVQRTEQAEAGIRLLGQGLAGVRLEVDWN